MKLRLATFGLNVLLALALVVPGATAAERNAGDPDRGKEIYQRCLACHSLERNRTGPRHCGLVGRRAGSVEGFPYSRAMRRSGIVWDRRSLDEFLAAPLDRIPGTSMGYAGIKDAEERADLIAFLASVTCPR